MSNKKQQQTYSKSKLEEQIKQAIKVQNEYLQLKLLEQYFSLVPLKQADYFYQNQYAFLIKKQGKVKECIAISKYVWEHGYLKNRIYACENLINSYLYLDNYEKAEEYLTRIMQEKQDIFSMPTLLLCFIEIKRYKKEKQEIELSNDLPNYYQSQIMKYKKQKFNFYMQGYFNKNSEYNQFEEKITLEQLEQIVQENLSIAVKSPDSYAVDFYYFDLNYIIGKNKNNQPLTGIKVVTLKNSNQVLAIEPIDTKDTCKIIAMNQVFNLFEQKQEKNKVHYKSQIEKFNRRYNRD